MGINIEENKAVFEGIVYEDEAVGLRDYLQEKAPDEVMFDFSGCEDAHMAVLQVIMAYKKLYPCTWSFGDEPTVYQKILEGFDIVEDHCS